MEQLDVIIIGAGPTGINCGISAQKAGLSFKIIEKGVLVNSLFHFPTNMTFFSTSKLLEIGDIPFISHNDKPTRKEALEYYRRLARSYELPINYYESVIKMSPIESGGYLLVTDKAQYKARHIVIATGFYDVAVRMNVPGESLPKVKHYYDEAHPYIGQNVLVVGAANSACDVALETWQKGANVTMAVRGPELYAKVKYWILPNIQNRIKEGSIKAYFNTTVREIKDKEVTLYNDTAGEFIIENDYVLAMTGYSPDYDLLQRLGIRHLDDKLKTPLVDKQTLETNLTGVYMAGVINGGLKTNKYFIENTREHGDIIMQQIQRVIAE